MGPHTTLTPKLDVHLGYMQVPLTAFPSNMFTMIKGLMSLNPEQCMLTFTLWYTGRCFR